MCGPESAKELLHTNQLIRVATKYPNIAKDYFYNKKHQTVEIIKLNGSIELAPIVGLCEVIVDIVETGSTLKENGLKVLEKVCPLSARMIVNQVSMKMEDERIRKLIRELRDDQPVVDRQKNGNCFMRSNAYKRDNKRYSGKSSEKKPESVRQLRNPGQGNSCKDPGRGRRGAFCIHEEI